MGNFQYATPETVVISGNFSAIKMDGDALNEALASGRWVAYAGTDYPPTQSASAGLTPLGGSNRRDRRKRKAAQRSARRSARKLQRNR